MDKKLIITAEYFFDPFTGVKRGWSVLVIGSRIARTGPNSKISFEAGGDCEILDLGDALLAPGFINCHNHLELTSLGPKVQRTANFTEWLDQVRELRDGLDDSALAESSKQGVEESIASGITTIINHCNSGASMKALDEFPIRAVMAHEMIAFDSATFIQRRPIWEERMKWPESERFSHGLAPHAPYSTSLELLKWVKQLKDEKDCIFSIHAAEHVEEEEFLKTGKGYFHDFHKHLGVPEDGYKPPGVGPVEYLHNLGLLGRKSICVHGNYLSDADINILSGDGASVCYCPRSHNYFYHKNHPLPRLLENGVNMVLGTDSMVSNWSLSLLEEMRFVYEHYFDVEPETIFKMATINAARALAVDDSFGRLEQDYTADIAAVSLPKSGGDALERALSKGAENCFTMIGGEIAYKKNNGNRHARQETNS